MPFPYVCEYSIGSVEVKLELLVAVIHIPLKIEQ